VLRAGLIGLGYWGPNYARVLQELPEAELAVACDLQEEALDVVRLRQPSVRATRDPAEVVGAEDVDAVIVATPTSTHYSLALVALEAGKHVLCEKPLAESAAQCDELIAAAARADRILFVGHTFIYNPAVRQMRGLIERGELGRILYCHAARTGLGPIRSDVNALWDLAPHDLSILFHLVGRDPVSVSAIGESFVQPGVEDVSFLHMRFEDGVLGAVHVSWLDPYKVRRVTVVGDRRMVVFDDVAVDEKLKVFDRGASYDAVSEEARGVEFGEFKAVIRDGDIVVPRVAAREPLKDQVADFVECCLTGRQPETDGYAGRRVVAVLEAASASLRLGRSIEVAEPALGP
jgi:predicted dehydrogenase